MLMLMQKRQHTVELQTQYPGCIVLSAQREDDIKNLHQTIVQFFKRI